MPSRREFLKVVAVVSCFKVTSVCAKSSVPLNISSLNITAPAWMFDEKSKSIERIRAISVLKNTSSQEIVVEFEANKRLVLPENISVQLLVKRNSNRPTRKSMLLKRTISYFFDSVFTSIAGKRQPDKGHNLSSQFEKFQAEEIVNVITIGAMYDLLLQLERASVISSVVWDLKTGKFKVNQH